MWWVVAAVLGWFILLGGVVWFAGWSVLIQTGLALAGILFFGLFIFVSIKAIEYITTKLEK
jgi:hypothetical protein